MQRLIAATLLLTLSYSCLLNVEPISSQTGLTRPNDEASRRALAAKLRSRIKAGNPSDPAFWQDIKQLEELGPPELKVAVVKHPTAILVYEYKNIQGLAVADHDVLLGPFERVQAEQAILRGDSQASQVFAGVTRYRTHWWPEGIVPFEMADDLEKRGRRAIKDAITDYENLTPVVFRKRKRETQYVRFAKQIFHEFLASMTDSTGANGGKNQVNMQTQDKDGTLRARADIAASARHEIGHALGMFHEHNRSDRDDYIFYNADCADLIYRLTGNFAIETDSLNMGPYDFRSIMHYPSIKGKEGPFWDSRPCFDIQKLRGPDDGDDFTGEIKPNSFLSTHDINALHHMYGRAGEKARSGDDYGNALLVHDFDKDSYPDLVVGSPKHNSGEGAAYVYKGTASGFVLWKALNLEKSGNSRFGTALAAGDFDGDGKDDLAVGAPGTTFKGKEEAGEVQIFRMNGNSSHDRIQVLHKPAGSGAVESQDRFGHALAAGFFSEGFSRKVHLAVSAPGARFGERGRVGRVLVLNNDREEGSRFRSVTISSGFEEKFAQFGFALVTLKGRPGILSTRRLDRLVISAPGGVTSAGCIGPFVYTTSSNMEGLALSNIVPQQLPVVSICPDPPGGPDLDDVPPPVRERSFGGRLASGEFNGDGIPDLAVSAESRVQIYFGAEPDSFIFNETLSNLDFAETTLEDSFGIALATGKLRGNSGLDQLVVGATRVSLDTKQEVGRIYVYSSCGQATPPTGGGATPIPDDKDTSSGVPVFTAPPGQSITALTNAIVCPGLNPWFKANETDCKLGSGQIGGMSCPKAEPSDHFGSGLAIAEGGSGTEATVFVGSNSRAHLKARAGAVFLFVPSLTRSGGGPYAPEFRNERALTSEFTTRFSRPDPNGLRIFLAF